MRSIKRGLSFVFSVAIAVAACNDIPTGVDASARGSTASLPGLTTTEARADPAHFCIVAIRSSGALTRYRHERRQLRFLTTALAADGSTLSYRYWEQSSGWDPVLTASCTIPRTNAAIEAMHQRFRVGPSARITFVWASAHEPVTTMRLCGSNDITACGLQALDVVVEGCTNPDWTRGEDGVCRSDRGSGGTTGGGSADWGGGGGGGDPSFEEPPTTAPEGIDQGEYDKLNQVEKAMCVLSPNECAFVIASGHSASAWAREQTPELKEAEGDNKRDALRHAAWQGNLTRSIGSDRARAWGDAHETSSLSPMATCMDQWNNRVGRGIGSGAGSVYAGVLTAWGTGQLIGAPFAC